MALTDIYHRYNSSTVFEGLYDEQIIERMKWLEKALYREKNEGLVNITDGENIFDVHYYHFLSVLNEEEVDGPLQLAHPKSRKVVIVLNGIFTGGMSNDHTAHSLTEEGIDVVCVDYPGKGKSRLSNILPTKEKYTPEMYVAILDGLLNHFGHYESVFLLGYSHGARIIYDYFKAKGEEASPSIKGVILGDMGPDRPSDAGERRAQRNQHNPVYRNLTEAVKKKSRFYAGHGETLPEDYIIKAINTNMRLIDDGMHSGIEWGYDPRSMFGYTDEITKNPRLNCWEGFGKISVPILFWRGSDSNTVDIDQIKQMTLFKAGDVSLEKILQSRHLADSFSAAAHVKEPVKVTPFYVVNFEGTGHYPEPHRQSHFSQLKDFINEPNEFSVVKSLVKANEAHRFVDEINSKDNTDTCGVLQMPQSKDVVDLPSFFQSKRIVPL